MDVLVLADTHIKRGSSRALPPKVLTMAGAADVILHAGDVVIAEVLEQLALYAPVHAVLGNNDHELSGHLPETLEIELAGVRVGMVHDSGTAKGREQRMASAFPQVDMVVFGHSHIPWDATGPDGQVVFNPGSPTERRRQPHRTAGLVRLDDGEIVERRIVIVDP